MEALTRELGRALAAAPGRAFDADGADFRDAAVLVPLVPRAGVPHLLFTRRPETFRTHAGQFSFPGGGRESSDAGLMQTALRETQEELAIEPDQVRVLGTLDQAPTISFFRVTPFVGLLPEGTAYHPNVEVDWVLEAPLSELRRPEIHWVEPREIRGRVYQVDFYDYQGHVIWGATGGILRNLLSVIESLPSFRAGESL